MPVTEGAPANILATHSHIFSFLNNRSVRQQFGRSPIKLSFLLKQGYFILKYLFYFSKRRKIRGQFHNRMKQLFYFFFRNSRNRRTLKIFRRGSPQTLPP